MSPSKSMAARPKYSNVAESQENDLKTNFMVMIEVLKEEIKKTPLNTSRKSTTKNWRKSINPLKNVKKAKKKNTNR